MEKDITYYAELYHVPTHEVLNLNPNLMEFRIPKVAVDWHGFRGLGIGASEVGVVVGVNHYNLLPKLVEEKVGTMDPYKPTTEQMLSGTLAEPIILARWMYHDGTDTGYIERMLNDPYRGDADISKTAIVRVAHAVDTYILNTKFPFLFCSLDGRVDRNQRHLSGDIVPYEWPLELKTIRSWEAQKWEQGVPPMYRFQVQAQMLITETEYAELAVLEDGVKFKVYPFRADKTMQDMILTKGEETYMLIRKLKDVIQERDYYLANGDVNKANKLQSQYESMLPLPYDEEVAKEYYSKKMLAEKTEFGATEHDVQLVRSRMVMAELIKRLDKEKQLYENLLMRRFTLEGGEYMMLGTNGKVRYYKVDGRKNYQFAFTGVKDLVSDDEIERLLSKLQS